VQVVSGPGRARPLVADQGREAALRAAIVRRLGRFEDLAPGPDRRLSTALPARTAKVEARRRLELVAARGAVVHHEERKARVAAVDAADPRIVAIDPRGAADVGLAEHLGVIGHGREIERTFELHLAQRPALRVVRLDADALAAREAIGVGGSVSRALGSGVERERGVNVQVAEERTP